MTKNSFNTFCYSVEYLKNKLNDEIVNWNTNLTVIDYNKNHNDKFMFKE